MQKTHGMSRTRIYRIWQGMKGRCKENSKVSPELYSRKGITVCKEWETDFITFYEWAMANGYSDNLVIDRKNPCKGYEPTNCQWITKSENSAKAWADTGIYKYMEKYPGATRKQVKNYDKAL